MPGYVFRNGPVYPMTGPRLDHAVVITRDDLIDFVGPEADVPASWVADAEEIDLAGRPLLPGFCDCHVHLLLAAEILSGIDCREVDSVESLAALVEERASRTPPGQWLTGFGWQKKIIFLDRTPRLADLDDVAPENPVFLMSKDAHSAWFNSSALACFRELDAPPAKCVLHTHEGAPTGLVHEGILELRDVLIPEASDTEKRARLAGLVDELHARGITTVHDNESWRSAHLIADFLDTAKRRVRVLYNHVFETPDELRRHADALDEEVPGWLCSGGIKLFSDGSLGSLTAAVSRPYSGTNDLGIANFDDEELDAWLRTIREVGRHAVVHVIGDRAAEQLLRCLGNLRWPAGTRHRLEHAQLLSADILERFAFHDLVFSVQPSHLPGDREILERRLAPAQAAYAYAYATMQARGGLVVFGSDAPVEDPDPWKGIGAAVTRLGSPEQPPFNPSEALSLSDALAAHTSRPAQLNGPKLHAGIICRGCKADLVVLSEDPFAVLGHVPALQDAVRTDLTFVNGELVFSRDRHSRPATSRSA